MEQWILGHEPQLRLATFVAVLALLMLAESRRPQRVDVARAQRWPANLAIVALDTLLTRLLAPAAAVGVALWATQRQWGLLNALDAPLLLESVAAFLALDLAIYWQHRLFHRVPLLWRLHRMHHSDLALDATTGLRFHPLEILLSLLIKTGVVIALGAPAVAVLAFEVVLNATSMFNHANLALGTPLDRVLRRLVVTPDMHRVHHSTHRDETDSNFGFNLPWWDRLFGSYRAVPRDGLRDAAIGLPQFREATAQRLSELLLQPFRRT